MKILKNIIISLLCGFAVFLICASLSVFAPLRASDPIGSGLALLLYFLMSAIVGVITGAGVFIMLFFRVRLKFLIAISLIPVVVFTVVVVGDYFYREYEYYAFNKRLEEINAPMTNPWGTIDKETLLAQLRAGANIDKTNKLGQTLLHYAAETKNLELMKFCVEHGADVNKKDKINLGNTPAFYTHWGENGWMLLDYLAENGADLSYDINGDPLIFFAAKEGSPEDVSVLLKHGASANTLNAWGNTPLFSVSTAEKAQILLDAGADVNFKSHNDYYPTPIFCHLNNHPDDILRLLIAAGADLEVRNAEGNTPLLAAMEAVKWSDGAKAKVMILLESGADSHGKEDFDAQDIEFLKP